MKFWLSMLTILVTISLSANAQHETDNWLLNQNTGLNFTSNKITLLPVSSKHGGEGGSSISDKAGNLLFYSNGDTVWNKNHQIIANGTGLLGSAGLATTGYPTGSQSCVIIPYRNSSTLYYIFHQELDTISSLKGHSVNLRYSVVDMAAQNGLGEVRATEKNVLVYMPPMWFMSRKLTAVYHANNHDVWLITHRFFNSFTHEFLAFKITDTGIVANPVISRIGTQIHGLVSNGALKVSPDGRYLAGDFGESRHVFRFNNKTGNITDFVRLDLSTGPNFYSIPEFSPDGSKIYFANQSGIIQYDLSSKVPASIISSKTVVDLVDTSPGSTVPFYSGSLQLAPNGRIYATRDRANFITEIANPNAAGLACNVRQAALPAAPLGFSILPNFMQSFLAPPRFTFPLVCTGTPVTFTIPDQQEIDSVRWDFGDATSGALNFSRQLQPAHQFKQAGNYAVKLTVFTKGEAPVFERTVTIAPAVSVKLLPDTTLCQGSSSIILQNLTPNNDPVKYRWSTGDTTQTISVANAGTYWLELNNGICTARDSVTVSFKNCPPPLLPNVITLNHDGINETFAPQYLPTGKWQLQMFNRWGIKVYENENYQNSWPEKKTAAGIYYYFLKNPQTNQQFKGWLEVIE